MAACVLDMKSCEPHHRTTCRVWALPQPSAIVKHCTLYTASTLLLPSIASAIVRLFPNFKPRPGSQGLQAPVDPPAGPYHHRSYYAVSGRKLEIQGEKA